MTSLTSTFNDLVISGLVGLVPREDNVLEVNPLIPADAWGWFCLDRVPYHGHQLTIVWDHDGQRYGQGVGFSTWSGGKQLARAAGLSRMTVTLPAIPLAAVENASHTGGPPAAAHGPHPD